MPRESFGSNAQQILPPRELPRSAFQTSSFKVAYQGGIEVRSGPFDAPRTGLVLSPNEVFAVTQEVLGTEGCVYLCLADGRGWVFDDTMLMPQDPSVVRLTPPASKSSTPPPSQTPPTALAGSAMCPPPPPTHQPNVEMYLSQSPAIHPPPMAPAPTRGELLASTPLSTATVMMAAPDQMQLPPAAPRSPASMALVAWYRVAYLGGIQLRTAPSIDAPLTGTTLLQNETFPVGEEMQSVDGRVYLRLADGRGWAFDDTTLMPHDPSVKRGSWMSLPGNCQMGLPHQDAMEPAPLRKRRLYPQPRGKRGGKRCAKRKQAAVATGGA